MDAVCLMQCFKLAGLGAPHVGSGQRLEHPRAMRFDLDYLN